MPTITLTMEEASVLAQILSKLPSPLYGKELPAQTINDLFPLFDPTQKRGLRTQVLEFKGGEVHRYRMTIPEEGVELISIGLGASSMEVVFLVDNVPHIQVETPEGELLKVGANVIGLTTNEDRTALGVGEHPAMATNDLVVEPGQTVDIVVWFDFDTKVKLRSYVTP